MEFKNKKLKEFTAQDIINHLQNHTLVNIILQNGDVKRLFLSRDKEVCVFNHGSRRRGKRFFCAIEDIKFITIKIPYESSDLENDMKEYKQIYKFRKLALEAKKPTRFGLKCIEKIPPTFEEWVTDGKKCLYKLGITTGTAIDGKLISLDSIDKKLYGTKRCVLKAIEEKTEYNNFREPFRGYDCTIKVRHHDTDGLYDVYLDMEYKDCGNGYYYIMINENYFIGIDKD